MLIRKKDDYFVIKIFKDNLIDINIFDINCVRDLFKDIFLKLRKKYDLHGLIDVDVYLNDNYGMIIEMVPVDGYFDDVDMKIKMHLNTIFLMNIDGNYILDYKDVYYYGGKFFCSYKEFCDAETIYKDTDAIMLRGIKVN